MLMALLTADVRQRLALWMLGIVLPKADAFKPHLRAALLSVGAAAMGGVLIALAAAAGLAAYYTYLVDTGIEKNTALFVVGGMTLVVALVALFIARTALQKTLRIADSFDMLKSRPTTNLEDIFGSLAREFLDGLAKETRPAPRRDEDAEHTASVIEIAYGRRRN